MTREEAIRIIEHTFQDAYVFKYYDSVTHQALNMAIEALSVPTDGDLISRADAIDAVAEMMLTEALADYPLVTSADKPDYIKLAAELFEDVPSADRPRWIPVTERLPNVGESVLFTSKPWVAEGCLQKNGSWKQYRWDCVQPMENVIAWMPLPEPYGGDESE